MKDFDIAKFLRENQLGSYGILNHYVDLKPLKEEELTEGAITLNNLSDIDHTRLVKWMYSNFGSAKGQYDVRKKGQDVIINTGELSKDDIAELNDFLDAYIRDGEYDAIDEDVTPEEIAEIPYEGPDDKLTGLGDGDTYAEPETVSEEEVKEEWHPEQTFDAEEMITSAINKLTNAGVSIKQIKQFVDKQLVRDADSAVFETISEAPNRIDWQDLEDTDLAGSGMEIEIDDFIDRTEKTIQFELTNDATISQLNRENPRQAAAQIRSLIKKLWLEKIRNWKG